MSSLGLKITGTEMEVGFTAATREEFDLFVARLETMAGTVWPPSPDAKAIGEDEPTDVEKVYADVEKVYASAAIAREKGAPAAMAAWRESQGLR